MSNFICPHCGFTNIDCGKDGFKTPKEIDLTQQNKQMKEALEKIIKIGTKCDDCSICPHQDENKYCDMECRLEMTELAQQALKGVE